MEFTELSNRVTGCAIGVHRSLGPGLLGSTYEQSLAHELGLHGVNFKIQYPLPVEYKGIRLDCGYREDVLVESLIILELKSVEQLKRIHEAQLLTYMKLAGIGQGFLINFNTRRLKQGLKSFVLRPFMLFMPFMVSNKQRINHLRALTMVIWSLRVQ